MKQTHKATSTNQAIRLLQELNQGNRKLTTEERLILRDNILNDATVAEEFFTKTLRPLYQSLCNKLNHSYKLSLQIDDMSATVYTALYDFGKWGRMIQYQGQCSIFTWMSTLISQVMIDELKAEGYLTRKSNRTSKNTYLTLKSIKDEEERQMIVDLVEVPLWNRILTDYYVKRMDEQEIQATHHLSAEEFRKTLKAAEDLLKEALIREDILLVKRANGKTFNLVTLALSDKETVQDITTSDEAFTIAENTYTTQEHHFVQEMLDEFYPNKNWEEQWYLFVQSRALQMNWSQEDQIVWFSRFIDHESPVTIAERIGRNRPWVDTRFSRLNKDLASDIKVWWERH